MRDAPPPVTGWRKLGWFAGVIGVLWEAGALRTVFNNVCRRILLISCRNHALLYQFRTHTD
jgi:hypothetical protein